jgi:hypothetical protein
MVAHIIPLTKFYEFLKLPLDQRKTEISQLIKYIETSIFF